MPIHPTLLLKANKQQATNITCIPPPPTSFEKNRKKKEREEGRDTPVTRNPHHVTPSPPLPLSLAYLYHTSLHLDIPHRTAPPLLSPPLSAAPSRVEPYLSIHPSIHPHLSTYLPTYLPTYISTYPHPFHPYPSFGLRKERKERRRNR